MRNGGTMHSTYRIKANEMDINLLESIKAAYKNKEIEINVFEIDETEYLLSNKVNRDKLLKAKAEVEAGKNIVVPDQENFH